MPAAILRRLLPARYLKTTRLRNRLLRAWPGTVMTGPFAGLRYGAESVGSVHIPKILGTYEVELHGLMEQLVDASPEVVLNIGAAEGYYSAGLASRLPGCRLVSWELSERGRALQQDILRMNRIDARRIDSRGFCSIPSLVQALSQHRAAASILVLVDIEGGEALLLDPEVVPGLDRCTLLVELHEFAVPGVEALLRDRFAATHRIEHFPARPRRADDWPAVPGLDISPGLRGTSVALMDEGRPPGMGWLYLEPRRGTARAVT